MTPDRLLRTAIDPALELLPEWMTSDEARAMLVATALQESKVRHRRQINGPARGYWQFEEGNHVSRAGVYGVLTHAATKLPAIGVIRALDYNMPAVHEVYAIIEHQDILAAALARLLLATLPEVLPQRGDADRGWSQYLWTWRPGRPHPETWPEHFATAWEIVAAAQLPTSAHWQTT